MIKGQDNLLSKIKEYTLSTLPHTILLVGEEGCGKHEMAKFISELFNLKMAEFLKSDCTPDTIMNLYCSTEPQLVVINVDEFLEKEQNTILKLIEEPSDYIYILLLSGSETLVLPTIAGRCQMFKFDAYNLETLKEFSNDPLKLKYCKTPGQIINASKYLSDAVDLCTKINEKISEASIGNILSIVDRINTKKEMDEKIPLDLFLKVLKNTITNVDAYKRLNKASKDLKLNIDKKFYLENLLIELKFLLR